MLKKIMFVLHFNQSKKTKKVPAEYAEHISNLTVKPHPPVVGSLVGSEVGADVSGLCDGR